jgi:hypothetical protein
MCEVLLSFSAPFSFLFPLPEEDKTPREELTAYSPYNSPHSSSMVTHARPSTRIYTL